MTNVNEVSRQSFPPELVAETAKLLGIVTEPTSLELKDSESKKVIKTINFVKVKFEDGEGTPDEKLARNVAFWEELQPAIRKDKNDPLSEVVRENNPLVIGLAHQSSSFDLAMRNGIRSKETIVLEGPSNAILASAKKLAAYKGISLDAAVALVKTAWGVE